MKKDLTTAIISAIVGVLASYIIVNFFFGEVEDFTISTVDPNLVVELVDPIEDIFNFRAVNPTVEVYVGECDEYDERTGECLDKDSESSEDSDDYKPDTEEETEPESSTEDEEEEEQEEEEEENE